jgi:hypothetical protein
MAALLFWPCPRHADRARPFSFQAPFAERWFRLARKESAHAAGKLILALDVIPDRTPAQADRRHCGRQPAVGRRLISPNAPDVAVLIAFRTISLF